MDKAAIEEKKRRSAGIVDSRKRPPSAQEQPADAKRIKLENESSAAASAQASSAAHLAAFDFTSLPPSLITELIVANLEAFSEAELTALVQAYRQLKSMAPSTVAVPAPAVPAVPSSAVVPLAASAPQQAVAAGDEAPRASGSRRSPSPAVVPPRNEEPVDPLKMDIDEEEIEFEPERLNEEVCVIHQGVSLSLNLLCSFQAMRLCRRQVSFRRLKMRKALSL